MIEQPVLSCPRCGVVVGSSDVFCPTCTASLSPADKLTLNIAVRRVDSYDSYGDRSGSAAVLAFPPRTQPPSDPTSPRSTSADSASSALVPSNPAFPSASRSPGFARGATRYLCAAVQVDSGFNAKVIRTLVHDKYRAVAFSPGVDIATVLKFALAARRRRRATDAVLLAETIAALALTAVKGLPFLLLGAFVLWLTVHLELLDAHERVLRPRLRHGTYDPREAPEPDTPGLRAKVEELAARSRGDNVTVGSGANPFAGFGSVDLDYSVVVDLAKGAPGGEPRPFTVHELVERVEKELAGLDLPGVSVASRAVVDGRDLGIAAASEEVGPLLPRQPDAPASHVDPVFISRLREDQRGRVRPYLAVRVTGWSGEVVSTLFVRLQLLAGGGLLLIGVSRAVLPPIRDSYQQADSAGGPLKMAALSAAKAPGDVAGAAPRLIATAAHAVLRPLAYALQERAISQGVFDYSPRWIPREHASLLLARIAGGSKLLAAPIRAVCSYHRYFQEADRDLYVKAVERKLFSTLGAFLTSHGIAADELESRLAAVQNLDFASCRPGEPKS